MRRVSYSFALLALVSFICSNSYAQTPCTYSINPTGRSHGSGAETGSVYVTTSSGCAWTATSNANWITIVSCAMDPDGNRAADNSGGFTGSGYLCYSVPANPGPNSRTGTITIAGKTFTVTQASPPCTYTLSVATWPLLYVGAPGTVTISPSKSTYCAGDYVTLTAYPNSGWSFSSWSGDASGSANPITLVMNSSKSVRANFTSTTPTCTYAISSTSQSFDSAGGTGSVGVTTGTGCSWTVTSNAGWITVTSGSSGTGIGTVNYSVSSNPGPNSRTGTITIDGWVFTVTQAAPTCTYALSVNTNPPSGVSVAITPLKGTYCAGDQVTLTAIPISGYTFSSWSGDASGSANPITLTMNSNKSVTANFTASCTYTLSASANPPSGGSVTINPQKSTYCATDQVTLTASPNSGFAFSSWSGDASGSANPITLTMNSNKSVTANFQSSSCTNLISPLNMGHGPGVETGSVGVTAGTGCSWTATSTAGWMTITSGSSGTGNGTVNYSVSANPSSNARTGTLTIAGRVYAVTQIGSKTEGFSNIPLPAVSPNYQVYGIHFPSFDTGWAVGHDTSSSRGVLLKYTASCPEGCDGTWEPVTLPSVSSNWYLVGVHFTSLDEGWAVGGNWGGGSSNDPDASATATTGSGLLLHYVNGSWSSVAPPSVSSAWSIEGVHFPSAGEGWAVGIDSANKKGVLLHYSQGSWASVAPPDVSAEWGLYGIYLLSTDEGWAVGKDTSNKRGALLHYSNGSWSAPPPPSASSDWYLEAVHFTSSNEGWAAGRDNANKRGVLLHYWNGFWTSVTPPQGSSDWDLSSVHFVSSSQGWASGNDTANNRGVYLRYSLGSWNSVPPPNVNSSWDTTAVKCWCSQTWSVGNDSTNNKGLTIQHTDGTSGAKPNLIPYRPKRWSDKIVVSTVKGRNTDSSILYNTQNLYVSFAVLNDSQMPIGSKHSVDLYVDGVLKDSREWDPLKGCHYGYLKDFPIGSLSVGTHSIRVKVNSTAVIDESNTGDNEYEKVITVVSSDKANVVLSQETGWSDRMIVSKKSGAEISYPLTIKDKLYVSWSLKNNGGAKTPGKVTVSLKVDGVMKKSWQKSSMAKSSKWATKNYSIGKLSVGEHEVKLVVAPDNLTPVNEGDHEVVKKINVQESAWGVNRPNLEGKWYLGVDEDSAYTLEGSVCNKGSEVGAVEYYLDWGDGSTAEYWYEAGQNKNKIHRWSEGYYSVVGKARCKDYPDVQSEPVRFQLSVTNGTGADGGDSD